MHTSPRWQAFSSARPDPKLRVAVKRTLAAFSERLDGEDALVDLVIALESLFGSTEGELTLRISTALAWLLGEGAEDRHHLQRDAKRVYRARSRVVHGGELSDRESEENQRRAEELVLAALRALFERRPELIAESERATKLILNEDDGLAEERRRFDRHDEIEDAVTELHVVLTPYLPDEAFVKLMLLDLSSFRKGPVRYNRDTGE